MCRICAARSRRDLQPLAIRVRQIQRAELELELTSGGPPRPHARRRRRPASRGSAGKVTTQARLSQTKGTGELSTGDIQRVIDSHVGGIQYCYEKQLRTNAGLAGRVVLEWTVSTSGSVSVVKVARSSLASNDATKCMMDRVKNWKFPNPRGAGAVTMLYAFVFNTI